MQPFPDDDFILYDLNDSFSNPNPVVTPASPNGYLSTLVPDPYDDYWLNEYERPPKSNNLKPKKPKKGVKNTLNGVTDAVDLASLWTNLKSGKGMFPKIAKPAAAVGGVVAAGQIANGLSNYGSAVQNNRDIVDDILASAGANQNVRADLDSKQLSLLRKLQNGTYNTSGEFDASAALSKLGSALAQTGTGFATGGWAGGIAGGIGGLGNMFTSGMTSGAQSRAGELESLYQALADAEMRKKQQGRQSASRYGYGAY